MKKYSINDLYFAKCRHCIMDISNVVDENGNVLLPRPDFIDYYTVLLLKNHKYVNIYDVNAKYKDSNCVINDEENYGEDIILEIHSLLDYIDTSHKKISTKECELIDMTIQKTKSLKIKYGYRSTKD